MTEIDIATLNQADAATLAKWWCELNRFRWPDAFVEPVPVKCVRHIRRSEMMDWIVAKIGIKECLRALHVDSMPGQKFDDWFDGRRRSDNANIHGNPQ